jgi:hypothetical protein
VAQVEESNEPEFIQAVRNLRKHIPLSKKNDIKYLIRLRSQIIFRPWVDDLGETQ